MSVGGRFCAVAETVQCSEGKQMDAVNKRNQILIDHKLIGDELSSLRTNDGYGSKANL